MEQEIKQLPYGLSDFKSVRLQNLYYVDKTMYLPLLEKKAHYLFFIRPRRFGKSMFLSMMEAYYDSFRTEKFDFYFHDLWIGSHPTPLKNIYQVLYLDFSRVSQDGKLEENFNSYCCIQLDTFMSKYQQYYDPEVVAKFKQSNDKSDKLNMIQSYANTHDLRLYLIIDEYDNFTNIVLNEQGHDVYHALTHASGFYRDVFKKFKGMFERIFMIGVSPVTLDDLTSGFNIGWNICTDPQFNMMLGFSEIEVRTMLNYYKSVGEKIGNVESMIADMKPWYDNYCFAQESLTTDPKMFNSDMVLYYISHYMASGEVPEEMLDTNTRTDYNKMKKLIQLDRLDGDRKGMMRKIAEDGFIYANVKESFPAIDMMKPDMFPSLLFYYGMLTMVGMRGTLIKLGIPNNNIRKQYYEYILEQYGEEKSSIDVVDLELKFTSMAFDGDWRPALSYIADAYKENSSVRTAIEGERSVQSFFAAFISLTNYYLMTPEVELNHGYADIFMLPNHTHYKEVAHSYIIEMKYLKRSATEEEADKQWNEAVEQVHGYAKGVRVVQLADGSTIHCIVMQFRGWDLARAEEV